VAVAAREATQGLDEVSVRAVEQAYDRAWYAGDLDALIACFTTDAVLVSPRGQVAIGEESIRELLGTFLEREAPESRHQSTVDRVAFAGDDVAVVDGHAVIASASDAPLLEHPFTDILVRTESGWLIAHVRAYQFEDRS
jgi:uncharacterized protein (TIGR02246 family)